MHVFYIAHIFCNGDHCFRILFRNGASDAIEELTQARFSRDRDARLALQLTALFLEGLAIFGGNTQYNPRFRKVRRNAAVFMDRNFR